jgi:hypothetical protein
LIEHLVRERHIKYVCSTTTISEGVNFPVSTVYFDTFYKGRDKNNKPVNINSNDFWNIAGRAGRTLVDNYGKILLPFNSDKNISNAKRLIEESSDQITSVLAELFENAHAIESGLQNENGLYDVMKSYPSSVSPLIQYFVHLLTIGENEYFISEIEDLFKDSLEYYLLDSDAKKQRFISICRAIYLKIKSRYQDKGMLSFASKTGFSIPSVINVMIAATGNPRLKDINKWGKEELFNINESSNLAEKIKVIAELPETKLGTDSKESSFSPDLYAKVIINWVKGEKIVNLANIHPFYRPSNKTDKEAQNSITDFVHKMNDISFKASWGLSALEGIVKGNEEIKDSFIPSMVYFGVDSEKALALRMIGDPRALSSSMQNIIEGNLNNFSFKSLRHRIKSLSNNDWDDFKPYNSILTGQEWKRISEILVK